MDSSYCMPQLRGNASWLDERKTQRSVFWSSNDLADPNNHVTDCYFCMVNTTGVGKKNKHKITYPNFPSAIRPVPHSDDVPVTVFKGLPSLDDKDIGHDTSEQDSCDSVRNVFTIGRLFFRHWTFPRLQASTLSCTEWFSAGFRSFKESCRAFGIKITKQKSCWSLC